MSKLKVKEPTAASLLLPHVPTRVFGVSLHTFSSFLAAHALLFPDYLHRQNNYFRVERYVVTAQRPADPLLISRVASPKRTGNALYVRYQRPYVMLSAQ